MSDRLQCSVCAKRRSAKRFTRNQQRNHVLKKVCYRCMTGKQIKADDIEDRKMLKWEKSVADHRKLQTRTFCEILAESYQVPYEISLTILELVHLQNIIPFYHPTDLHPKIDSKTWPVNFKYVYGVSFIPNRTIKCTGIQICANFGKVKTHCVLGQCSGRRWGWIGGCDVSWRAAVNEDAFDEHSETREFIFGEPIVYLDSGTKYRIGFFLSDGASLSIYRQTKDVMYLEDVRDVEWQFFHKGDRLTESDKSSYKWSPLIRLLY